MLRRDFRQRADYYAYISSGTQCNLPPTIKEPPPPGPDCPCTGNPINFGTGFKYQTETDLAALPGGLTFVRYYRSDSPTQNLRNSAVVVAAPGYGWQHNFHKSVFLQKTAPVVTLNRENGAALVYILNNGVWKGEVDDSAKLVQTVDTAGVVTGWIYTAADDTVETYDANGQLTSVRSRNGVVQTLTYDAQNLLQTVVDTFGRKLQFAYDGQSRLQQLTAPDGGKYVYAYDTKGNLISVTYPDNKSRSYLYENASFTHALTGIVDENGARFATWAYDALGRAVSSEHSVGVEKVVVDYSPGLYSRNITNSLGAVNFYSLQPIMGTIRIALTVQPAGAGSNPAASSKNYDTNGNLAGITDFNGNTTSYTFDLARNLEIQRVEASGTALAQTTTTQWHSSYRIPVQVNAPLLKTTYTHDSKGNVLTRTEQATGDTNGSQGASAAVTGIPRTWTYTYNEVGQVLTVIGPRTDVVDKTTYVYDTQANLTSITNAAGHVTTLSNYDANGRVGQLTDPNGVVTTLTYTPRGWLKQKVNTGDGQSETTTYDYDNAGQMTKVTLPDNSSISYTYDDAHRLTKINDNLGNSINYTLDNMGNRINETTTDTGGNLTRQTSRIYDALNRLQTVTGGVQ